MATEPRTLQEAVLYFADLANCREYLVARRWPNGVTCPRCGNTKVAFLEKQNRWQCSARHDARQFTSKTGTVMEESPIGLDKWLMATWLIASCKNGISSYEIHRALGVTQKTAWFLNHRIRLALHNGSFENLLSGECEADETFIGGKARNMHKGKRTERITGTGTKDKTAVMGILQHGGKVRTSVVPNRRNKAVQAEIRKHKNSRTFGPKSRSRIYQDCSTKAKGHVQITKQHLFATKPQSVAAGLPDSEDQEPFGCRQQQRSPR